MVSTKAAEGATIRLLLVAGQQELLTVYTDGFPAYNPLKETDAFELEYVVHVNGEYVDNEVHANPYGGHTSLTRRWPSSHEDIAEDKLTQYLNALQLRQ